MSLWQALFPGGNPQGGVEGTLPFRFENFGTFAGPQFGSTNYDYDKVSQELLWPNFVPGDFSFRNLDLGAYLYNNEFNYVGFHCDGVSTAQMYLQHSAGNIPIFNVFANTSNFTGNVNVIGNINATGNIVSLGNITSTGIFSFNGPMQLSGVGDVATEIQLAKTLPAKPFDIKHPNKEGQRLRHISLEGPEIAVYFRGKLKDSTIINLPDYWDEFVDKESITVNLTPVGSYQELFMEKIEWGKRIIIKNASGGPINCHYTVYAERIDMDKLIVEYEGESPKDYPGQDWLNLKVEEKE